MIVSAFLRSSIHVLDWFSFAWNDIARRVEREFTDPCVVPGIPRRQQQLGIDQNGWRSPATVDGDESADVGAERQIEDDADFDKEGSRRRTRAARKRNPSKGEGDDNEGGRR